MFKKNFIRLCNKNNVAPTVVCQQIGLTSASYSKWTDESVPRKATLMKLADYFGVTVEDLLAEDPSRIEKAPVYDERLEQDVARILELVAQLPEDKLAFVIELMENMVK